MKRQRIPWLHLLPLRAAILNGLNMWEHQEVEPVGIEVEDGTRGNDAAGLRAPIPASVACKFAGAQRDH
jgi:hypothetical protein